MPSSFLYYVPSLTLTLILVVLMIAFYLLGYRTKMRKIRKDPTAGEEGFGAVEGSLLGLLALLLSFTFGMSATRHDNRFQAIIEEANSIGTAISRADLFPDSLRHDFRIYFKQYVEARIDQFNAGIDLQKNKKVSERTAELSAILWGKAAKATQSTDFVLRNAGSLMVPALNAMIDSVSTRQASRETDIPDSILILLFLLCLASSFIVGYAIKKKIDWIMMTGFSMMIAITVFSILDLDRPNRGLIKLENAQQHMIALREMFTENGAPAE